MSPMPDFSDDDGPNLSPKIKSPNPERNNYKNDADHIPLDNISVPSSVDSRQIEDGVEKANNEQNLDITNANLVSVTNTEIGIEVTESDHSISQTDLDKSNICRDSSSETVGETNVQNNMNLLAQIDVENCGVPLPLFTKGYLCLPYLSLPYLDLLSDVKVRGYIVGATNVLFKQKRQLSDVLVDIENVKIECQDVELRKQLHLTTEDLRFADYIVKHVADERHDVFLDGVGWEGGDEWIRTQFRIYLLYLLKTVLLPGRWNMHYV